MQERSPKAIFNFLVSFEIATRYPLSGTRYLVPVPAFSTMPYDAALNYLCKRILYFSNNGIYFMVRHVDISSLLIRSKHCENESGNCIYPGRLYVSYHEVNARITSSIVIS